MIDANSNTIILKASFNTIELDANFTEI